ncbi:MAG: heterodisulfide reductase-related iron-sulfur binding cluster [Promethearchaeota archaeon]
MSEKSNEEFYCPCREADPDHFIENEEVKWLVDHQKEYKFSQEDYLRVYNCIHCNDCGTTAERFILKEKFLKDGGRIEGLEDTIKALEIHGTPFIKNKSRVRHFENIPEKSKTLLYMGCFTSIKTPKYAENIIEYLLKKKVNFTVLNEEICCGYPILCNGAIESYHELVMKNKELFQQKGIETIITTCPSCYLVFKKEFSTIKMNIKFFTEYLEPSKIKKSGKLIIQHACPLRNGEIPKIVENLENLYKKSGYSILKDVPNRCCGGGIGHQLRTDVINQIALKRMEDFKSLGNYDENKTFITTYCPDAYWIIKVYGKKKKIKPILKDMCELLF